MVELREVFEMVTKQTEPDLDSWKQQEDRQRRRARNQKLVAISVAAAAVVAAGVFVFATRPGNGSTPVDQAPTPVPFVTTPPIGAQFVTPDGTPVRQFPGSFTDGYSLQLSPDGTTIAYVDGNGYVHSVGVDGTNEQVLTGAGNTNDGDAQNHLSWSPDGAQIAYASTGNIYVMSADGIDQRQLTDAPGGLGDYYPAWSPDGATIAYWEGSPTGEDGGPSDSEIYTIPASGGGATRLTNNVVSNIEPAWSPDGTQIAYWDGGALLIMQADGSNKHSVYGHEGGAWAPSWSPDGRSIAFITYIRNLPVEQGGAPVMQLRTIELRTGNVSKLPVHSLTDWNGPQWVSAREILINRYS
jgi:WD40 repeat protein